MDVRESTHLEELSQLKENHDNMFQKILATLAYVADLESKNEKLNSINLALRNEIVKSNVISNSSQKKMLESDTKNSDQSLKLRTQKAELEKMQLVNDKLENEKLQLQMGLDVMTQKLNIVQRNNAIYEEKIKVFYKHCLKFSNSLQ